MTLISPDELARGVVLLVFGGLAGATATVIAPGTALWLLPAAGAVAGGALTVPEVREEIVRALPAIEPAARPLLNAPRVVGRWISTGKWGETRPALPAPARVEVLPATPPPVPARERAQPAPRPRWLEMVNDNPDLTPHALILGGTGAGKTTMATAIMADRGGRTVVLSPKVSAGGWAGAEVVSLDDDGSYAPIRATLSDLEEEKRRRIVTLRRDGPDALEPLTVVMDELVNLTTHEPQAGQMMVDLSSIGREIKMRLIGIGTTDDALNIRGWKASRNNYARIELDRSRRATISDGARTITVPAQDTLTRARGARLRPWRGEPEPSRVLVTPAPAPDNGLGLSEAEFGAVRAMQLGNRSVAADAPRADVVSIAVPPPSPDALLSRLMDELPADVRAAVPDISPERAARLAAILSVTPHQDAIVTPDVTVTVTGNSNVTQRYASAVTGSNGGLTQVNVTQVAAAGRARPAKAGGINVRARRLAANYRKAGADGVPFRKAFEQYGGSRNDVFKAWQDGRASRANGGAQ